MDFVKHHASEMEHRWGGWKAANEEKLFGELADCLEQ